MPNRDEKKTWETYRDRELAEVASILEKLGFALEPLQPHISGERYLMQAVTTTHGKKLILLARRTSDNRRVVVKATSDPGGTRELRHERECRRVLHKINFAYEVFFSPEEILFTKHGKYLVSIQAFLAQERPYLERPLKEQFSFALKAFKAQESAHAATYEHTRLIQKTFGSQNAEGYCAAFKEFERCIRERLQRHAKLRELLQRSGEFLESHVKVIEQYSGFLTHVDFVPHNFRIVNDNIYLLDHSSLRFGNKYEGWARFLNFMTLYNQPLEQALVKYVRDNRAAEESLSLKLMRVYRLGEIIWYYTDTLEKSAGALHTLNKKRVSFWTDVLEAVLTDTAVSQAVTKEYRRARDTLRSKEEKERQIGLH